MPIAGVLNNEPPASAHSQPLPTASTASVTPFSGRLSDLLLDPSQQHTVKRRKVDEQPIAALTGSERKLPKPLQQTKKIQKRPRFPPLLQGLLYPPPLPAKTFPPITGEGGSFSRDIRERVGVRSPVGLERNQEKDLAIEVSTDLTKDIPQAQGNDRDVGKPPSPAGSDKENRARAEQESSPEKAGDIKHAKRRKKWSEQETKDLLVGVSKYGIGNWKKILQCPDFSFNQRTAVDLKDRFRVCCPGQGLKPRKPKRKGAATESGSQDPSVVSTESSAANNQETSNQEPTRTEPAILESTAEATSSIGQKKASFVTPAELAELGIHAPFAKHKRRERREFTEQDDENLLKGFEKYASSWHSMRDDKELGFSTRHPTDLRDRFRIRYPELFAKAGYKLKRKDELMLKEKEKGNETPKSQESARATSSEATSHSQKEAETTATGETQPTILNTTVASNPSLRPLALREPLHSFPSPLEEFGDLAFEEYTEKTRSPVTLNRNILQWADANASQIPIVTSTNLPTINSVTGDAHLGLFNGGDGMHIDPLITVNLPMALLTSNVLSTTPSFPPAPKPSALPTNLERGRNISGPVSTISSSKQSMDALLRTPNLPTIVFPHVPESSAKGAVHNLPPPADLLSGMDLDVRPESQTASFVLDDTTGFALPSATLAPMMGGSSGRGASWS